MEFKPPIATRETDELIRIAHYPDKWNPLAVEQAKAELQNRQIPEAYQQKKVEIWNRFYDRKQQAASQRRAKEGYDWLDLLFRPYWFLVDVLLLDWNLKKEGYIRKHRQRKYILAVLGLLALILYTWAIL